MDIDDTVLTEDGARSERVEIEEWLRKYQTMQQQAPAVLQRLAYINGFLDGRSSES